MPEFPVLSIAKKSRNRYCGEFSYAAEMPWGPWQLTCKPKTLFRTKSITVLECFADENILDENGFAPHRSPEYDPCSRHLLLGKTTSGSIVWWHNLGMKRFGSHTNRPVNSSIIRAGDKVVVQGYGFEMEPHEKLAINIKTGEKSKLVSA